MSDAIYALYPVFAASPDLRAELFEDDALRNASEEIEALIKDRAGAVDVRGVYSTVGFRADADVVLWLTATSPEELQRFLVAFRRTRAGDLLDPVWTFMGMVRPAEFTADHAPAFVRGEAPRTYLCVYPFVRTAEWYLMPREERGELLVVVRHEGALRGSLRSERGPEEPAVTAEGAVTEQAAGQLATQGDAVWAAFVSLLVGALAAGIGGMIGGAVTRPAGLYGPAVAEASWTDERARAETAPVPPHTHAQGRTIDLRDGLLYASYWNDGLVILDIGNGSEYSQPVKVFLSVCAALFPEIGVMSWAVYFGKPRKLFFRIIAFATSAVYLLLQASWFALSWRDKGLGAGLVSGFRAHVIWARCPMFTPATSL